MCIYIYVYIEFIKNINDYYATHYFCFAIQFISKLLITNYNFITSKLMRGLRKQ